MNRRPENRALQTGDTVTRTDVPRGVTRRPATVAEILGRDPKREDVFVGGTGLIQRLERKRKP